MLVPTTSLLPQFVVCSYSTSPPLCSPFSDADNTGYLHLRIWERPVRGNPKAVLLAATALF